MTECVGVYVSKDGYGTSTTIDVKNVFTHLCHFSSFSVFYFSTVSVILKCC